MVLVSTCESVSQWVAQHGFVCLCVNCVNFREGWRFESGIKKAGAKHLSDVKKSKQTSHHVNISKFAVCFITFSFVEWPCLFWQGGSMWVWIDFSVGLISFLFLWCLFLVVSILTALWMDEFSLFQSRTESGLFPKPQAVWFGICYIHRVSTREEVWKTGFDLGSYFIKKN